MDAPADVDPPRDGVPEVRARPEEVELVRRLLAGDEAAFTGLVDAYHATMLRVARGYVPSPSAAEEVVQETWLAILRGLPRFQGRSSLKTWMFRILTNRAKTRGQREGRTIPMSAVGQPDDEGRAAVDPERFNQRGMWVSPPTAWLSTPDQLAEDAQTRALIEAAIDALPAKQRTVITLRDLQGWTSKEVCNVLEISETNQRVLLHRGRAKVRDALEAYLKGQQ